MTVTSTHQTPLLLAIDTSTRLASIALFQGEVLAEYTWQTQDEHTRELLPATRDMLERQKRSVNDLGGIVVALGPGSFNGVRVGVSTGKALALCLGIPIVGINTLEATAYQYAGSNLAIRPVSDAGRGQINTALYTGDTDSWSEVETPQICTLTELIERISTPTLLCGEMQPGWLAELSHHLGELVRFAPKAGCSRRAAFLAELGWRRMRNGLTDNIASLQPIYLRKPAITQPRRQRGLQCEEFR